MEKAVRMLRPLWRHGIRAGRAAPVATGPARTWGTRHAWLSPRYTTRLDELMEARAW